MTKISAARIDLEGGRLDDSVLKSFAETLVGGAAGTNTGSSYDIDISTGNTYHLILNASCTFTFSNPPPSGTACYITILLKQDGTGGWTAAWPFTVAWPSDTEPTVTTTADSWVLYHFLTVNGGNTWFGVAANPENPYT